ncbi:hypothetical protein G6F37_008053 [Rhizopus arrhizus]|nr:hypothetical protein G6F38_011666 [Rhizopus arrhizus]KAG1155967.1 hypothetical protein G6F37_008053 [Rhizopus arrhizus]
MASLTVVFNNKLWYFVGWTQFFSILPAPPNPIEYLLLPIPAILSKSTAPSQFKLPQKLKSAKVEELFHYHPEGHYLSQKAIADVDPSLKVVSSKLYNTLERQLVRIEDFFHECFFLTNLSLSSPAHLAHIRTNQLNFHSIKIRLDLGVPIAADAICTTTKQFRMAVQFTFAPSPINSNLWKQFWELALAFVQRNVIYRIIYKKLPINSCSTGSIHLNILMASALSVMISLIQHLTSSSHVHNRLSFGTN